MLFLALVDVSAEYSTASSLRGRSYEHRHINSQGILCHGPGAPDVELHARLAREPFLTEDCRRMLSSFLLRFPDASTEAAINEVHRWLVGRVIVLLRDNSESSPQAGPSGALSLTPRGEDSRWEQPRTLSWSTPGTSLLLFNPLCLV